MRNIDKKQIRGDIARRKAMPDFGISPDTNISRLKTIQETQRSFNLEVVETLLDELEAEQRISSTWRKTAESNRKKLEAAEKRIAELEASHGKLREAMAGIHNTITGGGSHTPLAAILNASKRAYEESAAADGKGAAK